MASLNKYFKKLKKVIFHKLLISSGFPKLNILITKKIQFHVNHAIDQKKSNNYLTLMDFIDGWFLKGAAELFLWVDYIQKRNGISGNLFEIGTYQGKSAILLALMVDTNKERFAICDDFDNKKNKIPVKQLFLKNLNSFFKDISFTEIYSKESNQLNSKECKNIRFFHIDGGHSADETYQDLQLASRSIIEGGIVAVDDLFNEFWPGVMEGVYKYLTSNKEIVPIAIGFNKLLLCKKSKQNWYLEQMLHDNWKNYITKKEIVLLEDYLLGNKIIILGEPK